MLVLGLGAGVFCSGLSFFQSLESRADGDPFRYFTRHAEENIRLIFQERLPETHQRDSESITKALLRFARQYSMDPAFVLSLIQVESGFRPDAVSEAGAIGLMQLMPETAQVIAAKYGIHFQGVRDLFNPMKNLEIGMCYLRELQNRYRGMSQYYALAAYNMGPARLDLLRARPSFKPEKTLKYYRDIMNGVDTWRFYSAKKFEAAVKKANDSKQHGYQLAENTERRPALRRTGL